MRAESTTFSLNHPLKAVKRLDWQDGKRHNVPVQGQFKMFPTDAQIETYDARECPRVLGCLATV